METSSFGVQARFADGNIQLRRCKIIDPSLLARWPVPLCAKTKPIREIRPVRGHAHGFFGAHDGAGRRAVYREPRGSELTASISTRRRFAGTSQLRRAGTLVGGN